MLKSPGYGVNLKVKGIKKDFGHQHVLRSIELEVQKGEFVAVIGRSGCGKSTLLRLIAGLDKPTEGEMLINDEPVHELNPEVRIMFQDARLLPWKCVMDNAALGLEKGETAKAETALKYVGLYDRAKEWPSVLSGGQKQRVALARALASHPKLLLLDEPLGALDALTRIEMQQLIESLWLKQKFTTILITHDVEEAVAMADRVILIEQGRIAMDIRVPFSRPRQRGHAAFAAMVSNVLQRVMEEPEKTVENHVTEVSPAYVL